MFTSVSEQLYIFLATLYGGVIIGIIYDLYRIFRGIFRPRKIATLIEDLVFWAVIGVTAFIVLLLSNDGQLRFYTFLGFALGAFFYIVILSPYVLRFVVKILKFFKRILRSILMVVLYPIKKLLHMIRKPCRWLVKKIQPIYVKLKRLKQLPGRWIKEMKRYTKVILKKK